MTKEQRGGGFSALSRSYKSNPTIENYVALRRKFPSETIEIAVTGGLDWLFGNEQTLQQFGISERLVAGILDADHEDISELSLQLLEQIIERKRAENSGKTHIVSRKLAISDQLVNFLINIMLDALDWNDDLYIPRDLIVLIRHQTGGGIDSDWDKSEKLKEQKRDAFVAALAISLEGKTPSLRAIANQVGVNASTVMRWYPNGGLAKTLAEVTAIVRKARKTAKARARPSGRARRRHSQPNLTLR